METITKIHLASQELNVIKRKEGYFNPYWQSTNLEKENSGKIKKSKLAKKEKQKKIPQITKIEL